MASSKDIRRLRPRPWIDRPPTRRVDGRAIHEVVLLGSRHQATISNAVATAPIKATRKSAAQLTLTVADPDRKLLGRLLDRTEDLLLDDNIDTQIGGIWWRLMGVESTETGWTMSFEDRAGAWLRRHDKPIRVVRGRVTRARFIHRLYREAGGGIDLWVPELRDKQRIAVATEPGDEAAAGSTAGSGEAEWVDLPARVQSVHGPIEMTPERKTIAAQLLSVAAQKKAPEKATLALAMAGLVESKLTNTGWSDGANRSRGVLQARPGVSAGPRGTVTEAQSNDVEYMAECFLEEPGFASKGGALRLVRENPGWTAGQVAQRVEMSAHPDRYDKSREGATALLKAFRGGALVGAEGDASGGGTGSASGNADYVFERGPNGTREDSLTCANRLADEVEWRHWIYGGQGYYASDAELVNAPIVLRVERDNRAVITGPTWKWDVRQPVSQMKVDLVVDRLPEPGQVVYVRNEGPASGRWLIDSVGADLAQPVDLDGRRIGLRCSLELLRAQKKKPEPAAPAKTPDPESPSEAGGTTVGGGAITVNAGGAKSIVDQVVQIALDTGGTGIWMSSGFRGGSITTSGNTSDHSSNDASAAARDIAVRGINEPTPQLDRAIEVIGRAFGRDYAGGKEIVDTFAWNGYRIQVLWRTWTGGNHFNHIHVGARKT